jgi:hypothetical protein
MVDWYFGSPLANCHHPSIAQLGILNPGRVTFKKNLNKNYAGAANTQRSMPSSLGQPTFVSS